jgi:copper transport protein
VTLTRIYKVALATCFACLLLAAGASAHAYPITTSPAIGGVVKASPATVSITYDESVSVPALAVYDAAGKLVSSATVTHPSAPEIEVAIAGKLKDGTYTVAWRVTSADTHVVHGVYTFSVGARGAAGRIGAELLARGSTPEGLALGFGIDRFLNLALMLLCCGGAVSLLWALRDAPEAVRVVLLRSLAGGGALLTLVALFGLPFEAAEANGTGLGGGFARLALDGVRHQRFGELWLVRAWLAALFALLALSLQFWPRRRRTVGQVMLALGGVGLLVTSTDSGHAGVSGPLAFIADGVHILTASVWLGGLAFVLAALTLSGSEQRWKLAAVSVPRFSLMAMISVPLLGAAAIVSAYLQVRVWRGLWDTRYGILLLIKIGLAMPLVALGAYNNRVVVPKLRAGTAVAAVRRNFLRAIGTELGLLAVVLGVSSALIDEAPAKSVLASPATFKPTFTATRAAGPFKTVVMLKPALAGSNTVDMTVTSSKHLKIGEVVLAAVPPGAGHKPVNLNVIQLSASRFRVKGAPLATAGNWQFEVTVRTGLTEWLARIPVTIGASR